MLYDGFKTHLTMNCNIPVVTTWDYVYLHEGAMSFSNYCIYVLFAKDKRTENNWNYTMETKLRTTNTVYSVMIVNERLVLCTDHLIYNCWHRK